eukprot:7189757-Pyramimonas_sp.AAC.1
MGVLLAGLQETRNPKGIRPCEGFHVLSSGLGSDESEEGGLGVELWASLDRGHFRVYDSTPRFMRVMIRAPGLSITVCVAHAPRIRCGKH